MKDPLKREQISKALKGRKISDKHKLNLSKACKGKKNGMFGKIHSLETKLKQSKKAKKRKRKKCPYCDKIGVVGNMNRWHFDNCKFKVK